MRRINEIYSITENPPKSNPEDSDPSLPNESTATATDIKFLCLAGAGIHDLARKAQNLNVESHSVLGSSFLNPR